MDAAGVVTATGQDVDQFEVGDRVIAQMNIGAMAELVSVPEASVWHAPDRLDLSHCANLGRNYFPAYHSLKQIGEIGTGCLVLVDGASGGVGTASIQLAKAMGAKVIAGVGIPGKAKRVLSELLRGIREANGNHHGQGC